MSKVQSLAEFLGTAQTPDVPTELPQLTVADFCKGVLESREYRQSVLQRITLGTLPPAVELRMYDYAYGKPVEKVEHTGAVVTEVRRVIIRQQFDPQDEDVSEKAEVTH